VGNRAGAKDVERMTKVFRSDPTQRHPGAGVGPWVGACLSVLLHALLLGPTLLGARKVTPPQPEHPPAGGSPGEDAAMTVELFTELQPQMPVISAPRLIDVPIKVNPIDLAFESDSTTAEEPGESELFGRYMGQVSARVERAWLRPRTPVGGGLFSCKVRIEQDSTGVVQEVALVQCSGEPRWQLSLVHAIQSASPLPAPPDPAVFRRTFSLTFQSQSYSPAATAELYEPDQPR
jgi:hypothetical protein